MLRAPGVRELARFRAPNGESTTIRVTESFLLTAVSTCNPRVMNVCASWVDIPTPSRSNHAHPAGMSQFADAMGKVTRG